jgi:hypothetical protein
MSKKALQAAAKRVEQDVAVRSGFWKTKIDMVIDRLIPY